MTPDIAFCLERIGRDTAGWDTLVVTGTAGTPVPAEDLWAVWTNLEGWPRWSPLHRSAAWTSAAGPEAGASFDQQISLGFPLGTTTQHVTFDLVEPARRAGWAGHGNGVRSCHLWSFSPLPHGGTQVSNTEAFTGLPVAMLRPLVARRWHRLFQAAVDGLVRSAAPGATGTAR
jgi:hypothetical protein